MAQPSTIYRTSIQLSDIDRNLYESLQVTVARHPSETEERLLARILAYALYYDPDAPVRSLDPEIRLISRSNSLGKAQFRIIV